jgi:hypothetical protein
MVRCNRVMVRKEAEALSGPFYRPGVLWANDGTGEVTTVLHGTA